MLLCVDLVREPSDVIIMQHVSNMGNRCCQCGSFGTSQPVQRKIILLLVGLDNSGKTTAAKGLTGEIAGHTVPTIGFSSIKMKHKGFDVIIYDLGGGPQIRGIWSCYFSDVYGVIFVVDASDHNRLEEARLLLYNLLSHEKLAGKPLLVLANKQDVPNALDEIDIVESLALESLVNQQKCLTLVEVCSALSPDNNEKVDSRLIRGYRWLVRQVINNYDTLNRRVELDMKEARAAMLVQREEWKKRKSRESEDQESVKRQKEIVRNGTLPPVEEANGYTPSSAKFSTRLKTQVDLAERPRHKKSNKVFPGLAKEEAQLHCSPIPMSHHPQNDRIHHPHHHHQGIEESSMIVRALTSPPRRNTQAAHPEYQVEVHTSRPFTSKSLGNGEVKTWGLDQELTLVDRVDLIKPTTEEESAIEYLRSNVAF